MEPTGIQTSPRMTAAVTLWLLLRFVTATANPTANISSIASNGAREPAFAIQVTDNERILVRVCRPASEAPARLVIINHGSPPDPADRPRMQLSGCGNEAAHWFLSRGYVVAFPLRRGYGATGGRWAESYGPCDEADYFRAGLETARDINAAVDGLTTLPFVRPNGAVIVGQSAGGWGTIAYNSVAHPKVAAFIVMAGGRGGHMRDKPNHNCHPERLVEAAGRFGTTATTPMLWVYAVNDTYFNPTIARGLFQSFTASGGHTEFEEPSRFAHEGHHLFFGPGGSAVWGPIIGSYLARQSIDALN